MEKLALDSLLWRRKPVLLGKKKIHNLHFHPQKFLLFHSIRVLEATVFALRLWHCYTVVQRSVTVRGDRDIFSAFVFGPCFNRPTATGRSYQRGAPPKAWCLSWGWTEERSLPCWPRAPGRQRELECSADPENVDGAVVHYMDLQCVSKVRRLGQTDQEARTSWRWIWGYKTVYPEDTVSVHTAPGRAKQFCNRACSRLEYSRGISMCVHVWEEETDPAASQPC